MAVCSTPRGYSRLAPQDVMAEALHLPWVLRRAAGLARDLQVRENTLGVALLTHLHPSPPPRGLLTLLLLLRSTMMNNSSGPACVLAS